MTISAEKLFNVLWRLAILALPWQTRWFSDATLAGWPWEQGRISLYASWVLIVGTIGIGLWRTPVVRTGRTPFALALAVLIFISCIATGFQSEPLRAVSQWWAQALMLIGFVFVMRQAQVPPRTVMFWVVLSLVPHVLLVKEQVMRGTVWGSTLLGIAPQVAHVPGTSVVQVGATRILRAYGGFPHPNIFGGWLAMGLLCAFWLTATIKRSTIYWWRFVAAGSCFSAIIASALFLTYSRTAWIAACIGLVLVVGTMVAQRKTALIFPSVFLTLGVIVVTVTALGFSQATLLVSRLQSTDRLEQKSLDERTTSIKEGFEIFGRNWFIGTGPNAELFDAARAKNFEPSPAPLQPPHNIFLLAIVNFGILGSLVLAWLLWQIGRVPARSHLLMLAPLFILGLFDHYLWSTWSGQALVAVAVLTLLPEKDHP